MGKKESMDRVRYQLKLQPKQLEAFEALRRTPNIFYGGARGGGKSHLQRAAHIYWITEMEKVTCAIVRRHHKELQVNHIDKIFQEYPELKNFYHKADKVIRIPWNNSALYFLHCAEESDLDKLKGLEINFLGVDECDNIPWRWIVRMMGSNRSSNPNVKARALLTGNPGGLSHSWLKRLFIDRKFEARERPEDYLFVPAFLQDNKYLDEDYRNKLSLEPSEQRRRAWLEGDWSINLGEFFPEFSEKIHVTQDVDLREIKDWPKFGAMDWGFSHPAAFGWFAVNPKTQQVILYRESLLRRFTPHEAKREYFRWDDTRELKYIVAGRDCFMRMRDGSPSVAESFFEKTPDRMILTPANDDRKQGWQHMRQFLSTEQDLMPRGMIAPRFLVAKSCMQVIDCFPRMIHKDNDTEDCAKINCTEDDPIGAGDDQIDMVRYGLMSLSFSGKMGAGNKSGADRKPVKMGRASSWAVV